MKPRSLEFCGINSFSETARIDFASLLEFGIFGIFGDTGSGKSTVLDCIAFALYGAVGRARSGSIADVINYKKDKAYVKFEFEIVFEGKRRIFLVEREIKRKNAVQTLRVYEKQGESYAVLSDGVREGNALLERIVGLEQKDFEKCIALPQGEFAQFVRSARADRLKLVSRLFDLEAYGVGLTKRVNRYCAQYRENGRVLEARLEPYAAVGKEANAALEAELAALTRQEAEEAEALSRALAAEQTLSALLAKKEEAERVRARLKELALLREETEGLREELSRLPLAETAEAAAREEEKRRAEAAEAEEELERAAKALCDAEALLAQTALYREEESEREIEALTEKKSRAQAAEELRRRKEKAERELERTVKEFRAEAECYRDFDYASRRAALEEKRAALGEGDFSSFVNQSGKAALFREEYGTFARELQGIAEKHPAAEEDIRPFTEKYAELARGDKGDYASVRRAFEERERARKEVGDELLRLEAARGKYEVHLQRLQTLSENARRLKEEIGSCGTDEETLSLAEAEARLAEAKKRKKAHEEQKQAARQGHADALAARAAARERCAAAERALREASARLSSALAAGGFASAAEAKDLIGKYGDAEGARARLREYDAEWAGLNARQTELGKTDFSAATRESFAAAKEERAARQEASRAVAARRAIAAEELRRNLRLMEEKTKIEEEFRANEKQRAVYEKLQSLIENNKFMEYVAEEYLQTVASEASERLLSLTDGRYFLTYGGGFFVGDNFNGGAERGVYTLSGGETFLVSLSLALSLGAEICRRSLRPIEFFFLDEGFGTLDERLVDVVMDSLEKLRGENLSIGIISHVEELKHRIDRKLTVKKATEKHGSQIIAE